MAQFLDSLYLAEVDDSTFRIVDHPFRYQSDIGGLITVPIGFETDFASVPRIGWIYALLGDIAHEPAVIHDWLYYSAISSRKDSDDILLEAMTSIHIGWRRYPIYWGVRLGGELAWNSHRKAGHSVNDFALS